MRATLLEAVEFDPVRTDFRENSALEVNYTGLDESSDIGKHERVKINKAALPIWRKMLC